MRLFANANYKFLSLRKTAYVISGVLLVIGVFSVAFHRGLNYGVDFTGGTLFQVRFEGDVVASDVRSALGEVGFANIQVQDFGREGEFLIRMAEFTEGGNRELSNLIHAEQRIRF
jgi:preprotein translocase subunit SecF